MRSRYVSSDNEVERLRLKDQATTLAVWLHHDTTYPAGGAVLATRCGVGAQTVLGPRGVSSAGLECVMRQWVEVAVLAPTPGIDDPHTARSVWERLGAVLCELALGERPSGVSVKAGRPVLSFPGVDKDGLTDTMFHIIRQSAAGGAAVLIRMREVLTAVVGGERRPERVARSQQYADLVQGNAERSIDKPADLDDLRNGHRTFGRMRDRARRHVSADRMTERRYSSRRPA